MQFWPKNWHSKEFSEHQRFSWCFKIVCRCSAPFNKKGMPRSFGFSFDLPCCYDDMSLNIFPRGF